MTGSHRLGWLAAWISLLASLASAEAERAVLRIPRVSRPPSPEDFLEGRPREAEATVTGFRQYDPGDGEPVSAPTTAYLSYDDRNLYVVFECKDDPRLVRARLSRREDILTDDQVGLFLDTFLDRRRAYAFYVNPLGVQLDSITTEGQTDDYSFDALWRSDGRLTPDGYLVWMAIPFRSLRFPGAPAQRWAIGLARYIVHASNEASYWPYVTKRVAGFVPQLAELEGVENVHPGRNLQLIPYGIAAGSRFLDRALLTDLSDSEARVGLDAKAVVRGALTLDATLNPDFSQVESDEPQVTVNQRFEVFYPEKRPFFTENAGFFRTPQSLFNSRRIVNPQLGGRLTGKARRWAMGALLTDDRAPGRALAPSHPLHGSRAFVGVARAQRELLAESSVGLLAEVSEQGPSYARLLAVDGRLKRGNWILTLQGGQSWREGLDGGASSGGSYYVDLSRLSRQLTLQAGYEDIAPGFGADLGFIPRVDVRRATAMAGYQWRPSEGRPVAYGPSLAGILIHDHAGRLTDWSVAPAFSLTFAGQNVLSLAHSEAYEYFQGTGFRRGATTASLSSDWKRWLAGNVSASRGTGINYYPPPMLAPFLAAQTTATAGLTLRPRPQLRLEETYNYVRLGTREARAAAAAGDAVLTNHILRSKLNWQFTKQLSLRVIADYNGVLPNAALVSGERSKRLTADFQLILFLNPGTAFYVGYTDNRENLDVSSGSLVRTHSPSRSTGHVFFIKGSYLFRF